MSSFIRFLTEVGFPIAGALSGGVFIFIILKTIKVCKKKENVIINKDK